jgi:hypothetical protein
MKYISYNLVSILLILISAYMIYADKDDWGWVMIGGIICNVTPSFTNNTREKSSTKNNEGKKLEEGKDGNG